MNSTSTRAYKNQFNHYLGGLSSWWIGLGLQSVIIPFLITHDLVSQGYLVEQSEMLGIVQMCTMLPAFLLILHAGITADRIDCRNIAIRLHLLALLPSLAIGLMVQLHRLEFAAIIIYALSMSVLSAYNIPSRDALLHRITSGDIRREISLATTVQFVSQVGGFLIAGAASYLEAHGVLEILFYSQSVVMLVGVFFMRRISPLPTNAKNKSQRTPMLQSLKEGFDVVRKSAPMRLVSLLNILVGLIFMGGLLVPMPLIVTGIYDGGSSGISIAITAFYAGVVIASIILSKMKQIQNIGLILVTVMALGSGAMLMITFNIPYSIFVLLILGWGMAVGFVFTLGRMVIQEMAPKELQARALSIYQLGITGGAPLGAISLGYLAHQLGPLEVLYVPALLLLIILLIACGTTNLLYITIGKKEEEQEAR